MTLYDQIEAEPEARVIGAPEGMSRLMRSVGRNGHAMSLAEHRLTHPAPLKPRKHHAEGLLHAVEASGLRGRGGGGFPTGRKMRAVANESGRAMVLVNGSEGEPASGKDKLLMQQAPHLVLDGALLAAHAVRASEVFVGVERSEPRAIAALRAALAERLAADEQLLPIHIAPVPPRYVAGEETALVHFINGGEAKPTRTPPRPFERGIGNRPTLVDNVETLAHVAMIAQWGPAWFRELGLHDEPGTLLVTASGAVQRPGICEVPVDVPFGKIVKACGGVQAPISAALVGGYYGTWVGSEHLPEARMSNASLRPIGSGVGCGAIVFMADGCGLRETARILTWMASETAGQCGPCVHGLPALAKATTELAQGRGNPQTVAQLERWCGQIMGRGGCSFPDGAVRLLRSALKVFAHDVRHHAVYGPCDGTRAAPVVHIPNVTDPSWR